MNHNRLGQAYIGFPRRILHRPVPLRSEEREVPGLVLRKWKSLRYKEKKGSRTGRR
jgi:hypothetical protein